MLKNLAPLGIDWDSIPITGASASANLAALLDICFIASDAIDTECFQPLRSTVDLEELVGPGGNRLVCPPAGNGNATAFMQHWPITKVLGGQAAPAAQFPPSWQQIPATSLIVSQPSAQYVGGSLLGSSGSDGMNMIDIQGGYVGWGYGRDGTRVQILYENGWPTAGLMPGAETTGDLTADSATIANVASFTGVANGAPVSCLDYIPDGTTILSFDAVAKTITMSAEAEAALTGAQLQIGYPAGVSVLNVDDVTGMLGTGPAIFDGATSEGVRIIGVAATDPVEILPGVVVQIGPGTIQLASPTRRAHSGTEPASALVSAMPSNVRLAGYYYAGDEALTRGSTAIGIPSLPGSMQGSGGTPGIGSFTKMAQNQLKNFKRVF